MARQRARGMSCAAVGTERGEGARGISRALHYPFFYSPGAHTAPPRALAGLSQRRSPRPGAGSGEPASLAVASSAGRARRQGSRRIFESTSHMEALFLLRAPHKTSIEGGVFFSFFLSFMVDSILTCLSGQQFCCKTDFLHSFFRNAATQVSKVMTAR